MLEGKYIAKYIGVSRCGFVRDHEYIINIDNNEYGYMVSGVEDLTDEASNNGYITHASEKSLMTYWDNLEEV